MLDGTDLNDAYTLIRHEVVQESKPYSTAANPPAQQQQSKPQQHTTLQQLQELQQQKAPGQQPPQQQPRVIVPAPPIVAMLPPMQPQRSTQLPSQPSQSYLEALVQQRREMLKYIVLSFVILLALACHNAIKFGFKEYILANDLSFKQELALRLGYPVAAFIVLWNLRALSK